MCYVFFFKQKTAYEMRISDWSSDVCSSDLNSAPPILYDIPDGKGGTLPALVRVGKTAQIFVLDRRNGKPVFPVEERPVPQDSYPGDRLSPTQPFSVAMPQIGVEKLTEQDMWGRSEEHTSELQSLMRISYAVFF